VHGGKNPDVKRTNLIEAQLLNKVIRIAGYIMAKVGTVGDVGIIVFGKLASQDIVGLCLNCFRALLMQGNRRACVCDQIPVVIGNAIGCKCNREQKYAEQNARPSRLRGRQLCGHVLQLTSSWLSLEKPSYTAIHARQNGFRIKISCVGQDSGLEGYS
jgi:hypothetical protein